VIIYDGAKPNERVVECSWVKDEMRGNEVSTSVVKWSEVQLGEV